MIKIYSKNCEHILRIMSQIPQKMHTQIFLAKNLCRKAKVSEHSARKGLQLLVQRGVLKAVSGPGGGYEFKMHPQKVSLLAVVEAFDGKETFRRCVMGLSSCNSQSPCPMHDVWRDSREKLLEELRNKSLFDLMKKDK